MALNPWSQGIYDTIIYLVVPRAQTICPDPRICVAGKTRLRDKLVYIEAYTSGQTDMASTKSIIIDHNNLFIRVKRYVKLSVAFQ